MLAKEISRRKFLVGSGQKFTGLGLTIFAPKFLTQERRKKLNSENYIVRENAEVGTPDWFLENPAFFGEIAGYANKSSFKFGDEVSFYVSTRADNVPFKIEFFRMGWYEGAGARKIFETDKILGQSQGFWTPEEGKVGFRNGLYDEKLGLFEPNWEVSFKFEVDKRFVPGVYLARLTDIVGKQAFIPLVIQSDQADFGVCLPVTTWQAYNVYGGQSLYTGIPKGREAVKVSFARPYDIAPIAGHSAGKFLMFDYQFVRWLERVGFNSSYLASHDLHLQKPANFKAFVSTGHDEYWTREMRDNLESARTEGLNLAFFSGNSVYWQARLEPSTLGEDFQTLVCYRSKNLDPVVDKSLATDMWIKLDRPQNILTGLVGSTEGGVVKPPQYRPLVVVNTDYWVFSGTGLRTGDQIPGIIGYEYDKFIVNSFEPKDFVVIARSPVETLSGKGDFATAIVFRTWPAGSWTFSAGTIAWGWGLDDWGHANIGEFANFQIQKMTENILRKFLN